MNTIEHVCVTFDSQTGNSESPFLVRAHFYLQIFIITQQSIDISYTI